MNPNEVLYQVNECNDFPESLPNRLNGIVDLQEFAQSIRRCNDAKRPSKYRFLVIMLPFLGMVVFGVVVGVTASRGDFSLGVIIGLIVATFALSLLSAILLMVSARKRREMFKQVVAEENARYTAAGRTPVAWSQECQSVPTGSYYSNGGSRTSYSIIYTLHIQVVDGACVHGAQPMQHAQGYPHTGFPLQPQHYQHQQQQPPPYAQPAAPFYDQQNYAQQPNHAQAPNYAQPAAPTYAQQPNYAQQPPQQFPQQPAVYGQQYAAAPAAPAAPAAQQQQQQQPAQYEGQPAMQVLPAAISQSS